MFKFFKKFFGLVCIHDSQCIGLKYITKVDRTMNRTHDTYYMFKCRICGKEYERKRLL